MAEIQSQLSEANNEGFFLLKKPGGEAFVYNMQGEIISNKQESLIPQTSEVESEVPFDDDYALDGTLLGLPSSSDCLYPATDDTGMEHKIISFGHVLKSTHDLARWSEKLGSQRVNSAECADAINLPRSLFRSPSQQIQKETNVGMPRSKSWQMPKGANLGGLLRSASTQQANIGLENIGLGDTPLAQYNEPLLPSTYKGESKIISSWPVLKSTHDFARWSEKQGTQCVNGTSTADSIDDLCKNGPVNNLGMNRSASMNSAGMKRLRKERETVSLAGTLLSRPNDPLLPPSKRQVKHEVIAVGPVLKSTHDMASWSEKRGPHRVNSKFSSDAVDVAQNQSIGFQLPRTSGSWRPSNININLSNTPLAKPNEQLLPPSNQGGPSAIIGSWPVLKSTHDMAQWSEKSGAHHVNSSESTVTLDEITNDIETSTLQRTGKLVPQELWLGTDNIEIWDTPLSLPLAEYHPVPANCGPCRIITTWPVLKSTHDAAKLSEKRGNLCVNNFKSSYGQQEQQIQQSSSTSSEELVPVVPEMSLSNTPLAEPNDQLLPPSDDANIEHKIISYGPVLKSTHDLATWSEKRGINCVNNSESSTLVEEVVKSEESLPKRAQFGRKSWRKAGFWNETQTNADVELGNTPLAQPNEQLMPSSGVQQHDSKILHSWPVLKSTHDMAAWSEKSGSTCVNESGSSMVIDEIARNQSLGLATETATFLQTHAQSIPIVAPPPSLNQVEGLGPLSQSKSKTRRLSQKVRKFFSKS